MDLESERRDLPAGYAPGTGTPPTGRPEARVTDQGVVAPVTEPRRLETSTDPHDPDEALDDPIALSYPAAEVSLGPVEVYVPVSGHYAITVSASPEGHPIAKLEPADAPTARAIAGYFDDVPEAVAAMIAERAAEDERATPDEVEVERTETVEVDQGPLEESPPPPTAPYLDDPIERATGEGRR